MTDERNGQVAVIFVSHRGAGDADGYAAMAAKMDALAARQPGYCGVDSVRGPDRAGITVSDWAHEVAASAWRDQAEHRAVRNLGRQEWYDAYQVIVARVERGYRWRAA